MGLFRAKWKLLPARAAPEVLGRPQRRLGADGSAAAIGSPEAGLAQADLAAGRTTGACYLVP